MDNSILKASHLSKYYGSGHTEVRAVDDISINIKAGELVLIMGPSGSGKTTLLSMLGALLQPSKGTVYINNVNISELKDTKLPEIRALNIGFIFQSFNLLEALTVEENILFPSQLRKEGINKTKDRADKLITQLNLQHRRNVLPHTLSGGEKQRVAIARALINEPKLILADEPTGNLDSETGQEVMMILHDLARDHGYSVLLVTHDPRVEEIADRILWLEDGKLHDRKLEQHAWAIDPVCGMKVDQWKATIFSNYAEKRYTFCSSRCQERFHENPDAYIK